MSEHKNPELKNLRYQATEVLFANIKGLSKKEKIYFIVSFFHEAFRSLSETIGLGIPGADVAYSLRNDADALAAIKPLDELIIALSSDIRNSYVMQFQDYAGYKILCPSAKDIVWKPNLVIDETLAYSILDRMQTAYEFLISWHSSASNGSGYTRNLCYRLGLILQICQGGVEIKANSDARFQLGEYAAKQADTKLSSLKKYFDNPRMCNEKIFKSILEITNEGLNLETIETLFQPFLKNSPIKEAAYTAGAASGTFLNLPSVLGKHIGSFLNRDNGSQLAQVHQRSQRDANQSREDKIAEINKFSVDKINRYTRRIG